MREHEEIQEKLIEVANRRYATKKFDPDAKSTMMTGARF